MDIRLRDHLAKLFNGQKKSKKDVTGNHRAMAKLLKEAQRLKTVLSANVDFMAQVGESLSFSVMSFWKHTLEHHNGVIDRFICIPHLTREDPPPPNLLLH